MRFGKVIRRLVRREAFDLTAAKRRLDGNYQVNSHPDHCSNRRNPSRKATGSSSLHTGKEEVDG